MSATTLAAPTGAATPSPAPAGSAGPGGRRPRKFTAAEFWKLVDQGFFGRRERVRLIDGEVRAVAPQGNLHDLGVTFLQEELTAAFGRQYWVRNQGGLDLSPLSVAVPDIAVVPGPARSYLGQRKSPTTAVLVVEVSDSTLAEDRGEMASLYAAAGIADYWIVNIPGRRLEVRRDPQPDPAEKFGHGYASLATLRPGDVAAPLEVPAARIPVADLMPH